MKVELTDGGAVVSGLDPGEPVFVLRGRDALAYPTINLYRQMVDGLFDADRDRGLMATQALFAAYARRSSNGQQLRFPD